MLPSDITSVTIYNQHTNKFEFRPLPIMAEIVLADEINRATPKTYSAFELIDEEIKYLFRGTTMILISVSGDKDLVYLADFAKNKGVNLLVIYLDITSFGAFTLVEEMKKT